MHPCKGNCFHYHYYFCQNALNVVRISDEVQEKIFGILASVLWLGNVSFTVIDNENHIQVVTDEGNKRYHLISKKIIILSFDHFFPF